jgi:integrase/recombinase XerC
MFVGKDFDAITKTDTDRYRHYLKNDAISTRTKKSLSAPTINLYLAALSSLYTYALAENLLLYNPVDGVRRMPVSPYEKAKWLQGDDDLHLLEEVNRDTIQGKRDFAILLLFLTAALRLDELRQLSVGSLKKIGDRTAIVYRKKGGEDVQKILAPITAKAIQTYLATRGKLEDDAPLFVATAKGLQSTRNLTQHTDVAVREDVFELLTPMSGRAIEKLIDTYATKAFGENHGITVHSLRHTAAMKALEEGTPITEISDLLKHKNTRVTAIYLHRMEGSGDKVSAKLGERYTQQKSEIPD